MSWTRSRQVRSLLIMILVIVAFKGISALTGFGAWLDATPAAQAVFRIFSILVFGVFGIVGLLWPARDDAHMRPMFYRLGGVLFLVIAFLNATILFGDPLNLVSE